MFQTWLHHSSLFTLQVKKVTLYWKSKCLAMLSLFCQWFFLQDSRELYYSSTLSVHLRVLWCLPVCLFKWSHSDSVGFWGLIAVKVKPFRSALLALLWTSNGPGMALMYVEGHCPVGNDILFRANLRRLVCACYQLQNLWNISTL